MLPLRNAWVVAGFIAVTGTLSSCGGAQDAAAGSAAERLLAAVEQRDGDTACSLLAPAARSELEQTSGLPCEEAVLDEELGSGQAPVEVEVFDTMAQAVVGPETIFLSRFDGRWLVIAAACTSVPDRPYDCSIGLP
jgi:hypothetical protein